MSAQTHQYETVSDIIASRDKAQSDLSASRAECERYREALTGILEQSQAVSATARIARQALEPK